MPPGKPIESLFSWGTGLNGSIFASSHPKQFLGSIERATPWAVMNAWRDCHYNHDPAVDNAEAVRQALRRLHVTW